MGECHLSYLFGLNVVLHSSTSVNILLIIFFLNYATYNYSFSLIEKSTLESIYSLFVAIKCMSIMGENLKLKM